MRKNIINVILGLFVAMMFGLMGCGGGGGENDPATNSAPDGSPSRPLNLAAVSGDSQATCSWSPSSNATSYTLYWSLSPNVSTSASTKIPGITSTTYIHTGLANGTTYYYRICGSNSYGASLLSDEISTTPTGKAPAPPQNISVTPGNGQVTATWSSVPTAKSYTLYWSTSPNSDQSASSKISGITGLSYIHTALSLNASYYYRISASNAYGESALSPEMVARPAQGMTISLASPSRGAVTDDPLKIIANSGSTYEITTVLAQIEGNTYTLSYDSCASSGKGGCSPGWAAAIPLTGMSRGSHTLVVTATDSNGSSVAGSTSFAYDRKPLLSVAGPVDYAVLRSPMLRVTATCSDDDPAGCASISAYADNKLLSTTVGNMDQTLALVATDGASVAIRVEATDSRGQKVTSAKTVFVESLPGLSEVATVGGDIKDFTHDRILYTESVPGNTSLKIRNLNDNTDTFVVSDPQKTPQNAGLTPAGAMYALKGSGDIYGKLYDFRNGTSEFLGIPESSFKIAGNYAMWFGYDLQGASDYLYLRDLASGTTSGLIKYNYSSGLNPAKSDNDVASNGDVVYWTSFDFDANIFRYRNGSSTRITSDLGSSSLGGVSWNVYPKTDGNLIVYTKQNRTNTLSTLYEEIYLYDGSQEIKLSGAQNTANGYLSPPGNYMVNNGWVAFARLGATNQAQIWLRSPGGIEEQATFFSAASRLVSLAPNGELCISNAGRLYLYKPALPGLRNVASMNAKPKYLNGSWQYVVGRTLFK